MQKNNAGCLHQSHCSLVFNCRNGMQFSSGSFAIANNQLHVMCAVSFGAEYQQNGSSFRKKQKTWTAVLMGLHHRVGSIRGFSRTRHRVAAKIRRNENGRERSEKPLNCYRFCFVLSRTGAGTEIADGKTNPILRDIGNGTY